MVNIEVNSRKVKVKNSINVLEACKIAGVEIPRFCYHQRLSVAGNCRMCLVEIENAVKPIASCAMPVAEGMRVLSYSSLVKKAREGVMEFLLANHPLDCPICDQGGECDLQDQAMVFGSDRGRFYEEKRAVKDKNVGPLVKTIMTRCIHCTRCVRYSHEVAGTGEFGTTGRGNSMEIGTYISNIFVSEVSGNIIDLCPVGALTSKPYAFNARPWELTKVETIDLFDSLGSNIMIEVRGGDVLRVLPQLNEDINEEWITDKVRFSYDGFIKQRLVNPLLKNEDGWSEISWEESFSTLIKYIYKRNTVLDVCIGDFVEIESAVLLKELVNSLGFESIKYNMDIRDKDFSVNYLMNTKMMDIDKADMALIIGSNIRLELPILSIKLRGIQLERDILIVTVGPTVEYFFKTYNIGSNLITLIDVLEGRHFICSKLYLSEKPLVYVSHNIEQYGISLTNIFGILQENIKLVSKDWDGRNSIGIGSSVMNLMNLGIKKLINVEGEKYNKVVYLLNNDNMEIREGFTVYQGHHGDRGASNADLILPGSLFIEKEGLYCNNLGYVQSSKEVSSLVGNSRTDWRILACLMEYVLYFKKENYKSLEDVRNRVFSLLPGYTNLKLEKSYYNLGTLKENRIVERNIKNLISDYYLTNSISRSSRIMGESSKSIEKLYSNYKWIV